MKHIIITLIVGALASIMIPRLASVAVGQNDNEFREKDELRRSFELTPGARVEVSSIRGSVDIETTDSKTAEVYIERSAANQADLEHYKVDVQGGQGSLIIKGETQERRSGSGMNPNVRHYVKLRLPRQIDLSVQSVSGSVKTTDLAGNLNVTSVSGSVTAGAVGGETHVKSVSGSVTLGPSSREVEIQSVSGNVKLEQASGSLTVSSVSGAVSAGISKLGERGVDIKSVTGSVELLFKEELNAELTTNSISGKLSLDIPNVTVQSRSNASAVRALIGRGGPQISINSVSSNVRLATGS